MPTVASILAMLLLCAGCHATRIVVPQTTAAGPRHVDRQMFMLGGYVGLSKPAGQECPGGLAFATSKEDQYDWAISIGLGLAGTLIGANVCSFPDDPSDSAAAGYACMSLLSGLPPFLFSTRTVTYRCARGNRRWAPSGATYQEVPR